MVLEHGDNQSEADEVGQQVTHAGSAGFAESAALVQSQRFLVVQHIQQVLLLVCKGNE